jgi:hypothetical protein
VVESGEDSAAAFLEARDGGAKAVPTPSWDAANLPLNAKRPEIRVFSQSGRRLVVQCGGLGFLQETSPKRGRQLLFAAATLVPALLKIAHE